MSTVHQFRRPTVLICGCLALLLGIGFAKKLPDVELWWTVVLWVPAIVVFRRQTLSSIVYLSLACACLGVWRGGQCAANLALYQNYFGQKLTFSVTALSDAVYNDSKQLSFDAEGVTINGQNLKGKIGVSGFGENMIYKGDRLSVTGKLRVARGSYKARASFAELKLQYRNETVIDRLRRRFGATLTTVMPQPLAPFGMGLLIGQRNTLPKETTDTLLWVGLTHIIAVSGYNLTILLQAARRLLARGSKYQILIMSLALIGTFLLFSGNAPSIVRAAIVSSIGLLAWYYGREINPLLLILIVADITAYANPSYPWSDSGWYLSFLAFVGIIILAPLAKQFIYQKFSQSLIGGMIVESLCAEAMTLPYLLFIFGQTSLVALWANLLIATFVPAAMLFTMIAGVAGLVTPLFAGYFAWPGNWVLNYMLDMCRLLSQIPHVFIENFYIGLVGMLFWYAAVIMMCWLIHRRKPAKYAIITDINRPI